MEHADIQQAHLSCWRRNPAIGGRENDIAAQIFGNRVAGKVLRRTIQHTLWMPLVACGFPQRPVLVIYQHQQSHMRARKASFQRFKKIRNRQQLVRAIHLRHVGPWSLGSASRTTKYALQAICIARTQALESDKAEQRHE